MHQMMRKRWFSLFCILATLQVLGVVSARAQAPAAAPAAGGAPGLENAIVTISVSDLPGFINNLATVSSKIQPTLTAEALKALVGNMFGDPQLQGFAPGTGVAMVVLPPNTMLVFAQVAPAQRDAYLQAAKMKAPGTVVAGDLLATSSDPTMANLATQLAPTVKSRFFAEAGKPVLKVSLNANTAATMFEPMMQGMLQTIATAQQQQQQTAPAGIATTPEGMKAQQQILEAELRVFISLLKQLKTLDLEVSPANGDLGLALNLDALPNTNLAKLFAAPTKPVNALLQLTPAKGAFRMVAATNGPEMRKVIQAEATAVFAQMQLSEEAKKSVQDMIEMSSGTYGDGFAVDMCVPGGPLMSGTMIYSGVEDPEKVLTMLQTAPEKMQGFFKMYEQMGMPMKMSFQKNVRQYKNLPIHRFDMNMQATGAPVEAQKMLEAMMGNQFGYDLAVVDKNIAYAMGGEKIEEMVDALQAGKQATVKPFKAQQVFGNDQQMYADLDVAVLVKSISGMVQKMAPANAATPQMGAQVETMFAGAEPVTIAGRAQGTQFSLQTRIPGTVITGIAQAGTMVFQQIMMAQQQAAAGAAAATPTTGTAPAAQPAAPAAPAAPATQTAPATPATPAQPAEKVDPMVQSEKDLRNISVALESYRIDNKRYPESLAQLSQKVTYFKSVPNDPFSSKGEPYHYTVTENGAQWTLWSVGPDGTDDEAKVPYDPAQGAAGKGDIVRSSVRTK